MNSLTTNLASANKAVVRLEDFSKAQFENSLQSNVGLKNEAIASSGSCHITHREIIDNTGSEELVDPLDKIDIYSEISNMLPQEGTETVLHRF